MIAEGCAPVEARLAVWFHDAVYVPGAPNNERASAESCVAYGRMLGFDDESLGLAHDAILATSLGAEVRGDVAAMVVDADLAVLAREPEAYGRYAAAIREEWSHVPDDAFREGRREVLEGLLAGERLFATAIGKTLYEEAARQNVAREVTMLSGLQ